MRTVCALALLALLLAPAAHAQAPPALSSGSTLVDGNASFSSSSSGDGWHTVLSLRPSLQHFVSDGLALGGSVNLGTIRTDGDTILDLGAGPAATYFFIQEEVAVQPFVAADLRFNRNGLGDDRALNTVGLQLSAGFLGLLTESVGLTGRFYYTRSQIGGDFNGSSNAFGLALGLSAFVF